MDSTSLSKSNIGLLEQKVVTLTVPQKERESHSPKSVLAIIDSSVEDPQYLMAGVKSGIEVFILDSRLDGISQINYVLEKYRDVATVHIVAHGTPGSLKLGSTTLNTNSLESYQDTLQSWSRFLKDESLLIYGCEVARGKEGESFLQKIHELTGANIAAATTKIGRGNWLLDYQLGKIDSELAFVTEVISNYSGTFDPVVTFSTSPGVLVETQGTVLTFRFELSEAPPPGGVTVFMKGNIPESISQLDVFDITVTGADFPIPDFDNSGFFLNITSQVATVSSPIFLDTDTDAIFRTPEFDPDDYSVTYTLEAGAGYTVDSNQNSGTVSFFDTVADLPTNSRNIYTGNKFPNLYDAIGGNDLLRGEGGDDTLFGGNGNDRIIGGSGKDSVIGGSGRDVLFGNGGSDFVSGGEGDDLILGSGGSDTLEGNDDRDTLRGGGGRDFISGGRGIDIIFGQGGNDVFILENTTTSNRDIIKDYTDRRDKFSLSGGISFNDLTIDEMGGNAIIKNGDQILAIVENVSANVIGANDFI